MKIISVANTPARMYQKPMNKQVPVQNFAARVEPLLPRMHLRQDCLYRQTMERQKKVDAILADPEQSVKIEKIMRNTDLGFMIDDLDGNLPITMPINVMKILEEGMRPSDITCKTPLYHGTNSANKASIIQGGKFNLDFFQQGDSGKGLYLTTSDIEACKYVPWDADNGIIQAQLTPGTKLARVKYFDEDFAYGGEISQIIKSRYIHEQIVRDLRLNPETSSHLVRDLIGQFITDKAKSEGYQGLEIPLPGGSSHVVVFDPKNIQIIK